MRCVLSGRCLAAKRRSEPNELEPRHWRYTTRQRDSGDQLLLQGAAARRPPSAKRQRTPCPVL